MKYAKLKNENLEFAPARVIVKGNTVTNPDPEILQNLGYKEVIFSQPENRESYTAIPVGYRETDTQIIQLWDYEKSPKPDYDFLVESKIAEKYSTGKEISINRKGVYDAQNTEYLEYIAFIDECKNKILKEIKEWENV